LLLILASLASLTYDLFHTVVQTAGHDKRQVRLNTASVAYPILIMILAYLFDTHDKDADNSVLNVRWVDVMVFVNLFLAGSYRFPLFFQLSTAPPAAVGTRSAAGDEEIQHLHFNVYL
jgi:hypothetical protein